VGASRIAAWGLLAILVALSLPAAYFLRRVPRPLPLDGIGVKGSVSEHEVDPVGLPARIAGAVVEVFDADTQELLGRTTTDAWGRYAVPISRAADCRIQASKPPEFEQASVNLRIASPQCTDFALQRCARRP
jgi:hypothetical protein